MDKEEKYNISLLDIKFICPECGGTYFGSTQDLDGTLRRHCHGSRYGCGCAFSWNESDDDDYCYVAYKKIKSILKELK